MTGAGLTQNARPVVLLLTATVDPGQVIMLKRRDPRHRFKDYQQALKKWCRVPAFQSIIFCENSAYDISPLRKWAANTPKARTRVRFISFSGNGYSPNLGKSYGEMGIIRHALTSVSLPADAVLVKTTGRYYVRNINPLVDQIKAHPDCRVFCDEKEGLRWADSRVFAATVSFYEKFLLPLHTRIDDSAGVYFEHVLADAVRSSMAKGMRWMPWSQPPQLSGISGTFNEPYDGPRHMLAVARMKLLERSFRIRRVLGLYRKPKVSSDTVGTP